MMMHVLELNWHLIMQLSKLFHPAPLTPVGAPLVGGGGVSDASDVRPEVIHSLSEGWVKNPE